MLFYRLFYLAPLLSFLSPPLPLQDESDALFKLSSARGGSFLAMADICIYAQPASKWLILGAVVFFLARLAADERVTRKSEANACWAVVCSYYNICAWAIKDNK